MAFVVPSILDRGYRDLVNDPGGVVALGAFDPLGLEQLEDLVAGIGVASELTQQPASGVRRDQLVDHQVEDRADHLRIGTMLHGLLAQAESDRVHLAMLRERELDLLALNPLPLDCTSCVLGSPRSPHG